MPFAGISQFVAVVTPSRPRSLELSSALYTFDRACRTWRSDFSVNTLPKGCYSKTHWAGSATLKQHTCRKHQYTHDSTGERMTSIREECWQGNITYCVSREGASNPSKFVLKTGTTQRHAKALQDRVAAMSRALRSDKVGLQKGGLFGCLQTKSSIDF